jgi:ABC-type metal ion transport system substrate-binding protein
MDGADVVVDDDDAELVALMKVLDEQGLIKIAKKAPDPEPDPEPDPQVTQPEPVKAAAVKPSLSTKPSTRSADRR